MPSSDTQFKTKNTTGKNFWFKRGYTPWSKGKTFTFSLKNENRRIGEKNPMWQGGISPIHNRIRRWKEYKKWRTDIFIRDNFICQNCGETNLKKLEPHHLESVDNLVKKYGIKDYKTAIACKELWDADNGVILCKECHCLLDRLP